MVSLIAHAVLGILCIWFIVRSNPDIFRRVEGGPAFSVLEATFYVVGVASIAVGWWFNISFVNEYGPGTAFFNPLWGDGSWAHYMQLMFANPAAGSAGGDFTIGNVILLPLMAIIDGRRRGIARPWMFFVITLFTSFSFGWAFYLATVERQRRLSKVTVPS